MAAFRPKCINFLASFEAELLTLKAAASSATVQRAAVLRRRYDLRNPGILLRH